MYLEVNDPIERMTDGLSLPVFEKFKHNEPKQGGIHVYQWVSRGGDEIHFFFYKNVTFFSKASCSYFGSQMKPSTFLELANFKYCLLV